MESERKRVQMESEKVDQVAEQRAYQAKLNAWEAVRQQDEEARKHGRAVSKRILAAAWKATRQHHVAQDKVHRHALGYVG